MIKMKDKITKKKIKKSKSDQNQKITDYFVARRSNRKTSKEIEVIYKFFFEFQQIKL